MNVGEPTPAEPGSAAPEVELAQLDRTYVSGIERGERNPSLANILMLAAALDVNVSQLALRAEQLGKTAARR